jgi:hypothetical protein
MAANGIKRSEPRGRALLPFLWSICGPALLLLLCLTASGQTVRLAWDPAPTVGITNYTLYASTNALSATNLLAATTNIPCGTNLTGTVSEIVAGRWWFAATAWKDGIESLPSNVLQVEVPRPPANMRTVVVQYSGTLTNFYDVGFFKLRLP